MSILKSGKAKAIRFSTLEAICEVLNCQPGDILEYMSAQDYKELTNQVTDDDWLKGYIQKVKTNDITQVYGYIARKQFKAFGELPELQQAPIDSAPKMI